MTFNQIVWKMARVQYKKYLFYYLCNSFAVMFFFMFSTVYFNTQIEKAKKLDGIQDALSIPGAALIVFTVFFISYAHNVFMKRRRSEFGLFMTLGMSRRDLSRLLLLENGVIAFASIVTGLLAGAIFSRLFFMILMNRVGLQEVPFHLDSRMFIYTIGAFFIVFFLAVGKSLFQTLRSSMIQSMKSNRVAERIKMRSPIIGALGLVLMVGSILSFYFTYAKSDSSGAYLPLWTMAILLGLYISLSQFSSFLIELAKKSPFFYFRRMLYLTSIDHKFKQLTSIIMLVTVMIMITIFYSTLLLTFHKSSEKDAIRNNPYDVAFFQTETKNNLSEEEMYAVLDQRIEKHHVIPTIFHYEKDVYADGYHSYMFMSLDDFNRLTSDQKKLGDKEYLYYLNVEPEYGHGDVNQFLALTIENEETKYTFKGKVAENNINMLPNAFEWIIVNQNEFDYLRDHLNGIESNLHLINVADWKAGGSAVEKLQYQFTKYNQTTAPIEDIRTEYHSEEELFGVASKIGDYEQIKNTSGIMFFVTTFLSVMFFFGTFILLYLNLFSEIEEEKAKYKKLNKIGMTSKEVKGNISKELMTIFFVPTVIGTLLAFIYIVILSTDAGGIMKNQDLLIHFFIISGTYLCIQIVYYLYASKKMLKQLMG
jgi:ABC-type antimicrobial peptide transport system permease subunit